MKNFSIIFVISCLILLSCGSAGSGPDQGMVPGNPPGSAPGIILRDPPGSAPAGFISNEYFIATDGSDSNPGTSEHPWATFKHAFETMSRGDVLVIKDGYYDQDVDGYPNEIISYYGTGIPDGYIDAYTVIKAENAWGVTIADRLLLSRAGAVQIEGINFKEGGGLYGSLYIKIQKCSFTTSIVTGNHTVVTAGTGCSYILFEDCFAYGGGRYKFMAFGDQNVPTEKIVFRRCVSRHDYHDPDDWGWQAATFTSYDAHDVLFQNCISIDSGHNSELYGFLYGGIWFENKGTTPRNNSAVVQDCIFLNLEGTAAINDPINNGVRIVDNCVIWDTKGGYLAGRKNGSPSIYFTNLTIGNIWGRFQDRSYAWGTGVYAGAGFASSEMTNSLVMDCNSYGAADYVFSDYNNFYGDNSAIFGNTYGTPAPVHGANDTVHDPGLKYICRIEDDSLLKGSGHGGGDIGATIIYKRGVSGTLWGDPGYNDLTSEKLWPFPNEDIIKNTMRTWPGPNDGTRGFCADGTGLYGGPVTLTSYIWEYLGNECPEEIYAE